MQKAPACRGFFLLNQEAQRRELHEVRGIQVDHTTGSRRAMQGEFPNQAVPSTTPVMHYLGAAYCDIFSSSALASSLPTDFSGRLASVFNSALARA